MKTILTIIPHYLPGYKAGGPIRSLTNFVERLGDDFCINILTSDRDLGDEQPYPSLITRTWQKVGKANVLYLPNDQFNLVHWYRWLTCLDYDVIYLNSFFSILTIKTLLLRRLGLLPCRSVVIAPRGEFSSGALTLKQNKKRLFIFIAKITGIYRNITWQASSKYEAHDIRMTVGSQVIYTAPNLPSQTQKNSTERNNSPIKKSGDASIVFLSRIHRTKNLDFVLNLFSFCNSRALA